MKTHFLLILLVSLLSLTVTNAQTPTISDTYKKSIGTPYKIMDSHTNLFYDVGDGIHAIKIGVNKYGNKLVTIQKYNLKTGQEVKRTSYTDLKQQPLFVKMAQLNNRLYYIYESFDKKTKLSTLYALGINLEEGTFLNERKIFTTEKPIRYMLLPYSDIFLVNRKFQSTISEDASKIAFFYLNDSPINNDKKNYETYSFRVFDEDLEKVLFKDVKMPYSEAQSNILSIAVSNLGSAYMLFHETKNKRIEMVQATEKDNHFIKVGLNKGFSFNNFFLSQHKNGHILCTGIYDNHISDNKKDQEMRAEGIYTFELTEDSPEIINEKTYDVPTRLLKDYEKEAKNPGVGHLNVHTISQNEDGSIVFITEQQRMIISDQIQYYYHDIILWKANKNGDADWVKRIDKTQNILGGYKEPVSFKHFKEAGTHYLFHYEKIKSKIYLTVFEVDDETGKQEKHTILDMENMDGKKMKSYQHQVRNIFKAGPKTFGVEAYAKKKNDVMIRVELK